MSISGYAAQNAVMNAGSAGMLSNNAYNTVTTQSAGTGVAMGSIGIGNGITGITQFGQPLWNEDMHNFQCQKVENGWTLNYRNKQYIAADLDSLMDQMKAAMVMERIEK